jgi:hypothetical protein
MITLGFVFSGWEVRIWLQPLEKADGVVYTEE